MAQKRERSVNFTREETNLLVQLVADKKQILENKKSDAVTWGQKERCWKAIEASFNSKSGANYRSVKNLKLKYESIKKMTRKKSANIRPETYATGGNTAQELTPDEDTVKNMILLSVDGMKSEFDSDHVAVNSDLEPQSPTVDASQDPLNCIENSGETVIMQYAASQDDMGLIRSKHSEKNITPIPNSSTSNVCLNSENVSDSNKNWTQWKARYLQSKKHPALCKSKPRKPFKKLAESKLDIADLQRQLINEELENKRKEWIYQEKVRKQEQKRWDFEEEERQHKRFMWALEKEILINKLKGN